MKATPGCEAAYAKISSLTEVALCIQSPRQTPTPSLLAHEFLVGSRLNDNALVEETDPVRILHSVNTMSYRNCSPLLRHRPVERVLNRSLGV